MKFSLNKIKEIAAFNKVLEKRVGLVKHEYSKTLWENLYEITPRNTGAAAASWNISLNTPNYSFSLSKTSNSFSLTVPGIDQDVFIATGCPYMYKLNNGWSQKAPTNFIERCITIANNQLNLIIKEVKEIN